MCIALVVAGFRDITESLRLHTYAINNDLIAVKMTNFTLFFVYVFLIFA